MKHILIVLSILLLATFAVFELQQQQNMRGELQTASSMNDELQWMILKTAARMNRDSQEVSALEVKVNALTAGQK